MTRPEKRGSAERRLPIGPAVLAVLVLTAAVIGGPACAEPPKARDAGCARCRGDEEKQLQILLSHPDDIAAGYAELLAPYSGETAFPGGGPVEDKTGSVTDPCDSCGLTVNGLSSLYDNGARISFSVKPSNPGYLYAVLTDADRNIYLVFPNAVTKDNKVKKGRLCRIPDAASKIKIFANAGGSMSAAGALHIIWSAQPLLDIDEAVKSQPPRPPYAGYPEGYLLLSQGQLSGMMKKLNSLKRGQWLMRFMPYKVMRRLY